jgi:hypothetical protein
MEDGPVHLVLQNGLHIIQGEGFHTETNVEIQVLDSLVEFQGQLVTQTNITIFQGDLELSLTSKFLNEVEGDSGTIEIELGGFVPLQDKVSLHWNLFCHPRLTNQLQSSDGDQNGAPNGDLMGTLGFQLLGFQRDLLLKKTRISL